MDLFSNMYPIYVNANLIDRQCVVQENNWSFLCDYLLEKGLDDFNIELSEDSIKIWVGNHDLADEFGAQIKQFINKNYFYGNNINNC